MKTILLCTSVLFSITCHAQQVFSTCGKTTTTAQFTIGEPIITTLTNSTTMLTQGFHQPIYQLVTRFSEHLSDNIQIEVFPNPTNGIVSIKTTGVLYADIISIDGTVYKQNIELTGEQTIDLSPFASGIYYLNVRDTNNTQTSYKVFKTNQQ